jgi:iron-sulfur cluster repair protein YtfE (RIC family)
MHLTEFRVRQRFRKKEKKMDAFELLKQDHRKVEKIFAELEPTTERALKTREELFRKLQTELEIHTQIEETILYPVLRKERETRDITFEGYEEHDIAKRLLEEMATMDVTSEVWTAKLKVLQEAIEHHVEEEENEMFKAAREALTKEEIQDLGVRLEAKKQELAAGKKAAGA